MPDIQKATWQVVQFVFLLEVENMDSMIANLHIKLKKKSELPSYKNILRPIFLRRNKPNI